MAATGALDARALGEAAARLVAGLRAESSPELHAALLARLAARLDAEDRYPLFLKLLWMVGTSDDLGARIALAQALAAALERMALPTGCLTSWGAGRLWPTLDAGGAQALHVGWSERAPTRRLGPIEYLFAWSGQTTQRARLAQPLFESTLDGVLRLVDADADARARYLAHLSRLAGEAGDGALSGATRRRLGALIAAWARDEPRAQRIAAVRAVDAGSGRVDVRAL